MHGQWPTQAHFDPAFNYLKKSNHQEGYKVRKIDNTAHYKCTVHYKCLSHL